MRDLPTIILAAFTTFYRQSKRQTESNHFKYNEPQPRLSIQITKNNEKNQSWLQTDKFQPITLFVALDTCSVRVSISVNEGQIKSLKRRISMIFPNEQCSASVESVNATAVACVSSPTQFVANIQHKSSHYQKLIFAFPPSSKQIFKRNHFVGFRCDFIL